MGSVLSYGEATKPPAPSQARLSDGAVLTDSTLFGDTARFHGELPFAALAVEASHEANIKCLSFRNRKAFWRGDVGNPAKDVAVELGVFCEAEFTSWVDAPKGH